MIFGDSVRREHDVGRLEVAVDDAALVGMMHRPRESDRQFGGRPRCERFFFEQLRQAATGDILHRKVWPAVAFADFVNLNDVRVLKLGELHRFDAESF